MRAWVLHGVNDIRYEEADKPVPRSGEALIRVAFCGICGSDIPRIYETGAHRMPLIPGHEFSGIVEETAAQDEATERWIGKRVAVFPLIPCRKCNPCRKQLFEMCRNYDYIGSRRDGAFAEYVTAPLSNLIEIPPGVSLEEAAMTEPLAVAVHAVMRGTEELSLSREAAAAVCGPGTIGMMVLMLLIGAGYKRIFVIGNKDGQRIRAVTAGLCPECFCDIREADPVEWLRERTDGIDLYFECVGKNASISLGIDVAAPCGRIVAVGNPYTDITFQRNTWWRILRNQLTVIGTWNSSFDGTDRDDWHRATECLRNGCVPLKTLITHRLPLEKAKEGFRIMRERKEDHGKVLLVGNEP